MNPVSSIRALTGAALALLIASQVSADCNFSTGQYRNELADIASVRAIEVRASDYRKWVRNGLRIITSNGNQILAKYKKKHRAEITVRYDFGTCTHAASIKQNGDFKDHVQLDRGRLLQSLTVKLEEGNIANSVRFKLFLKETRRAENEILGTLLLSRLGFLAPRTRMIPTRQNGTPVDMLWQEMPSKEFLERNNRREGPLFEGDERVFAYWSAASGYTMEDLGLSRLINDKWTARGAASLAMTMDAFTRLQRSFASYGRLNAIDPSKALTGLDIPGTDNARAQEQWWDFAAVLFAMRASHGLRPHNRKFYWNALLQAFEPIYYDGEVDFRIAKPRYLRDRDRDLYFNRFSGPSINRLAARVRDLDAQSFSRRFAALCGSSCEVKDAKDFLDTVAKNLDDLAREMVSRPEPDAADPFPPFVKRSLNKLPDHSVLDVLEYDPKNQTASAQVCTFNGCRPEQRDLQALIRGLSGMTTDKTGGEITLRAPMIGEATQVAETLVDGGVALRHSPGAKVRFDAARRILHLSQSAPQDWFLLLGGKLTDIRIVFEGLPAQSDTEPGQRFNKFGLTGCVTISDVAFDGGEILAAGGRCEDSVNIIGSSGRLAAVTINAAMADALDVDFSKLEIGRVEVAEAGNDCLDVSGGDYAFDQAILSACGDKAISIGEASRAQIGMLNAASVGIGISSKDGSTVTVDRMDVVSSGYCYEAMQKKQEFSGSFLSVADINCNGQIGFVDSESVFGSERKLN